MDFSYTLEQKIESTINRNAASFWYTQILNTFLKEGYSEKYIKIQAEAIRRGATDVRTVTLIEDQVLNGKLTKPSKGCQNEKMGVKW